MSSKDFVPQLIQFKKSQPAPPEKPAPETDFGIAHQRWRVLTQSAQDPIWAHVLQQQLNNLESETRITWLNGQYEELYNHFEKLAQATQKNHRDQASDTRSQLLQYLNHFREAFQERFLPLLTETVREQGFQQLSHGFLTRLDALRLNNYSAFEKSREANLKNQQRCQTSSCDADELLAFLQLERLLDTVIDYQFAWERWQAKKAPLSSLEKLANKVLKVAPPTISAPPQAALLKWQQGEYQTATGLPIRVFEHSFLAWMKQGFRSLQQAMKEKFSKPQTLKQALLAFYTALLLEPQRAEPALALAWLLTLFNQPQNASLFLQYALQQEALPEIQLLLRYLRNRYALPQRKA